MTSEIQIVETAKKTIDIEYLAVKNLKASINQDFVDACKMIYQSKGRLVVTGIGKSALIGKKIVATLNSTGTASIFMHAADAIHGDLGMVQKDDILLCISKSGETAEVKVLVPLIKNLGNPYLAMVSRAESYLAQHADKVLLTPMEQEADPNNLAPTTSTTLQTVMGDALATSLLKMRGFTPNDFAQFHPGGALGKQLYLKVSDLYPNNPKPQIQAETPVEEVLMDITSNRLGCTVVVDDDQHILGIITDGDIRRMLKAGLHQTQVNAKEIMSLNPKTVDSKLPAVKALEIMKTNEITQLIVVEEDQYVGVIHLHDLLKEGLV